MGSWYFVVYNRKNKWMANMKLFKEVKFSCFKLFKFFAVIFRVLHVCLEIEKAQIILCFFFVLLLLLFFVLFFKENLKKECNDIRNKKKNCL